MTSIGICLFSSLEQPERITTLIGRINKIDNTNFGAKARLQGPYVEESASKAREITKGTAKNVLDSFNRFKPNHTVSVYEDRLNPNNHYFLVQNEKTGKVLSYEPSTYTRSFYKLLQDLMDTTNPKYSEFWGIKNKVESSEELINHSVFVK